MSYKQNSLARLSIMLLSLSIALTLAVVPACAQEKQVIRVLFVGNSIIQTYNMPIWVTELSKNLDSVPPIETADRSVGGARLRDHLQGELYSTALEAIRKGGWDIVVIQGHGREPLEEPDQFFMAAAKLAEEVRAIGAEPLFFQTYAYPQDSSMYKIEPLLGGNPAEMQVRISTAYAKAAEQAKARIARIGDAFQWVINSNPEINLYSYDMDHPSARGSYLMACIFISLLTDKDPCAATWIPSRGVTEAEAKVLRAVAKKFSEK